MTDIEQELTQQGYVLHRWSNAPEFWYPVHEHPYEKIIVILTGSITFYLPAAKREVALTAGSRLMIPPHTTHSASVGPDGVTCLEGHRNGG